MKKLAAPGRRGSTQSKAFKSDHDELVDEIDITAAAALSSQMKISSDTEDASKEAARLNALKEEAKVHEEAERKRQEEENAAETLRQDNLRQSALLARAEEEETKRKEDKAATG